MRLERVVRGDPPGRRAARRAAAAMTARVVTAVVGGYAATAASVSLLARLLPVDRAEATVWAMLCSFLVYAVLLLWSFHEPRLGRVAALVWGIALVAGGALRLLGVRP